MEDITLNRELIINTIFEMYKRIWIYQHEADEWFKYYNYYFETDIQFKELLINLTNAQLESLLLLIDEI